MTVILKACPFCGAAMNKDNTLEWFRDAEDRIVVAAVFCLSCKRAVWREGEEGENG